MQIIGFNLTKSSIERSEKFDGKLNISQNIGIDKITKDKINLSKEEVIKIKFTSTLDYNEGEFAKIEIKGEIVIMPTKDELEKFKDNLDENNVPDELKSPLFNFIKSKSDIISLKLEDELNLPYHIKFPTYEIKSKSEESTK